MPFKVPMPNSSMVTTGLVNWANNACADKVKVKPAMIVVLINCFIDLLLFFCNARLLLPNQGRLCVTGQGLQPIHPLFYGKSNGILFTLPFVAETFRQCFANLV